MLEWVCASIPATFQLEWSWNEIVWSFQQLEWCFCASIPAPLYDHSSSWNLEWVCAFIPAPFQLEWDRRLLTLRDTPSPDWSRDMFYLFIFWRRKKRKKKNLRFCWNAQKSGLWFFGPPTRFRAESNPYFDLWQTAQLNSSRNEECAVPAAGDYLWSV